MGWRDRDYSGESSDVSMPGAALGIRRPPHATLTLMILHGAAWILMKMLASGEGAFIPSMLALGAGSFHALGVLLHPLANTSVLSAIFVILALWSLGGRLEPLLGWPRFIGVYLSGNVAAGLAFILLGRLSPALANAPLDYPAGALAGLIFVAWQRLQHDQVQVFGKITTVAKVYAVCAAIVAGLALLGGGLGAIAWLAAAGAGVGAAALAQRWSLPAGSRAAHRRRTVRPSIPKRPPHQPAPEAPDVDEILAKISREGIESLSNDERARLEAARRARLRHPP